MAPLAIGLLTGLSGSAGLLLWYLLAAPEIVLSSLDEDSDDGWYDEVGPTLTAMRVLCALALSLLAFVTGAVTAVLSATFAV